MAGLTTRVEAWRDGGELVEIGGRRIFVRSQAGDGPPVLLLHGYPSSSYDWRHTFELLPGRRLSPSTSSATACPTSRATISTRCWPRPTWCPRSSRGTSQGEPVALVAHDMGSSVATEVLARDIDGRLPFELDRMLLFNASLVLERASLLIGQKILRSRLGPIAARLTNERSFKRSFGRIFSAAHPLSPRGGRRPVGAARAGRRKQDPRPADLLPPRARRRTRPAGTARCATGGDGSSSPGRAATRSAQKRCCRRYSR